MNKQTTSGRNDDELDALLSEAVESEQEVYVPKLRIRKKKKGEQMRALGSRVPVWMIEDLKMLADYQEEEVCVEDLVAGVIEQVLEDNMEAVYKKAESEARKRRGALRKSQK